MFFKFIKFKISPKEFRLFTEFSTVDLVFELRTMNSEA